MKNEDLINIGFYSWGVWLRHKSGILIHSSGRTWYVTDGHIKIRAYPKTIKDVENLINILTE